MRVNRKGGIHLTMCKLEINILKKTNGQIILLLVDELYICTYVSWIQHLLKACNGNVRIVFQINSYWKFSLWIIFEVHTYVHAQECSKYQHTFINTVLMGCERIVHVLRFVFRFMKFTYNLSYFPLLEM